MELTLRIARADTLSIRKHGKRGAAVVDNEERTRMAIVVVELTSEYLPDGSFHVYSREVPGFHVVEPAGSKLSHRELYLEKIAPILRETMERRVIQAEV